MCVPDTVSVHVCLSMHVCVREGTCVCVCARVCFVCVLQGIWAKPK